MLLSCLLAPLRTHPDGVSGTLSKGPDDPAEVQGRAGRRYTSDGQAGDILCRLSGQCELTLFDYVGRIVLMNVK